MNYQNNYDRLNAITKEMSEGIEVDTWGYTGIVFKPAGIYGLSSVTMRNIEQEFLNFMYHNEGIVLNGKNNLDNLD